MYILHNTCKYVLYKYIHIIMYLVLNKSNKPVTIGIQFTIAEYSSL